MSDDNQVKRIKLSEYTYALSIENTDLKRINDIILCICMKGIVPPIKESDSEDIKFVLNYGTDDNRELQTIKDKLLLYEIEQEYKSLREQHILDNIQKRRKYVLNKYKEYIKTFHIYDTIDNKQYGVLRSILIIKPEFYNIALCYLYDYKKLKVIDAIYNDIVELKMEMKISPYDDKYGWYSIEDKKEDMKSNEYCFLTKLAKDNNIDYYKKFYDYYDESHIPYETLFIYFCRHNNRKYVEEILPKIFGTTSYNACIMISLTEALKYKRFLIAYYIIENLKTHPVRANFFVREMLGETFTCDMFDVCAKFNDDDMVKSLMNVFNPDVNDNLLDNYDDELPERVISHFIHKAAIKALNNGNYAIFKCLKYDCTDEHKTYLFYRYWNGKDDITKKLGINESKELELYKFKGLCCNSKIDTFGIVKSFIDVQNLNKWDFKYACRSGNYNITEYLRSISGAPYTNQCLRYAIYHNHIQLFVDILNNFDIEIDDYTISKLVNTNTFIISAYIRLNDNNKKRLVTALSSTLVRNGRLKNKNKHVRQFVFSLLNDINAIFSIISNKYFDVIASRFPPEKYRIIVEGINSVYIQDLNTREVKLFKNRSLKFYVDTIIECLNAGVDIKNTETDIIKKYKEHKLSILNELKIYTRSDYKTDYYTHIDKDLLSYMSKFVTHEKPQ
jgi:hypothetical protein